MLSFAVLSSGSRGNAIYVRSAETEVLIDCGLSAREAARRLSIAGVSAERISSVLVTHEHSDHICGIPVFCRKFGARVLANRRTLSGMQQSLDLCAVSTDVFCTGESFQLGSLGVEPFTISHDAAEPVGFRLSSAGHSLVVMTDLGRTTPELEEIARCSGALILESNHDLELLSDCPYPADLKRRILSDRGHLSNPAACAMVTEVGRAKRLRYLVGAHVSEKSNLPHLVLEGFTRAVAVVDGFCPEIRVADAFTPTPLVALG